MSKLTLVEVAAIHNADFHNHSKGDGQDAVNCVVAGDALDEHDMVVFGVGEKPPGRSDNVGVLVDVADVHPVGFGVGVVPSDDSEQGFVQVSHTTYSAVTLPRSGLMKWRRWDGLPVAATNSLAYSESDSIEPDTNTRPPLARVMLMFWW